MRKNIILEQLKNAKQPIKGAQLAEMVGVSRQVVVQDIAVMRAQGVAIMATPQGYILQTSKVNRPHKILACCHNALEEMVEELETMVFYGGKVLNVIVEHPVYGEIQGNIAVSTLADVELFVRNIKDQGAMPLASLTNGVHLHTVEADNWEILKQIEHKLLDKGFLVDLDKL